MLIDLLKVAIKASDTVSFNKTKNFIQARRDLNTAINYIGIAFLELNDERWRKMLSKIGHIPSDLLWSITLREVKLHRADVLHTLFNVFNKPENSSVDLEMLLGEIYKLYGELPPLRSLYSLFFRCRGELDWLTHSL